MKKTTLLPIFIIFLMNVQSLFLGTQVQAQENTIRVFDSYNGRQASWMKYQHLDEAWYQYLHTQATQLINQREEQVQAIKSPKDWQDRKNQLKEKLLLGLGGLPEKTALNSQVLGKIDRETFHVEKILYESLPGFYVSASLFIPRQRQNPAPAIIYCSGHALEAFRSETYQHIIINLVKKGFVVLAFDPIGQGERLAYLEEGAPFSIKGNTREHSYSGIQSMMIGHSLARYMVHDGMRAVDYLLSRPEVDGKRIGITGRSGGGTQSALIAAADERILAAAPENYITSFLRIWESIGPQDAEQNLLSSHKLGIDHADLLSIRAPKPALVLTTSRDFFSIQGAKESFQEVKNLYKMLGKAEHLYFAQDDHQHGSTPSNREAMYRFFQKELNLPGNPKDEESQIFTPEELSISPKGNVFTLDGSKDIFALNHRFYTPKHKKVWKHKQAVKEDILSIASISNQKKNYSEVYTGRHTSGDYVIEKYFLEFSDGHYPLPYFAIYNPQKPPKEIILYLSTSGKPANLEKGSELEELLQKGYLIIAADMLNTGELANAYKGDSHLSNVSYNLIFGSSLIGKSLPALQAEDMLSLLEHLSEKYKIDLSAMAEEELGVSLLHAALVDDRIKTLILKHPLLSWENMLYTKNYLPKWAYAVIPGALTHYDLPDLMSWIPSQKLIVWNPVRADGQAASLEDIKKVYSKAIESYTQKGSGFMFKPVMDPSLNRLESFFD